VHPQTTHGAPVTLAHKDRAPQVLVRHLPHARRRAPPRPSRPWLRWHPSGPKECCTRSTA